GLHGGVPIADHDGDLRDADRVQRRDVALEQAARAEAQQALGLLFAEWAEPAAYPRRKHDGARDRRIHSLYSPARRVRRAARGPPGLPAGVAAGAGTAPGAEKSDRDPCTAENLGPEA